MKRCARPLFSPFLHVCAMTFFFACGGSAQPSSPEGASTDGEWVSGVSADGSYVVKWRVIGGTIPRADPFDVEIRITDAKGNPSDAWCTIDAEMPEHGHGMNVVPQMQRTAEGHFLAKGLLLHMPGRWSILIDARIGAVTERTQFLYVMP